MVEFADMVDVLLITEPPADLDIILFAQDLDQRGCPTSPAYHRDFDIV